jgi:hypothetical protein
MITSLIFSFFNVVPACRKKSKEYSQNASRTDRQLTFTYSLHTVDLENNKEFQVRACEFLTTPTLQFLFKAKIMELNLNLISI